MSDLYFSLGYVLNIETKYQSCHASIDLIPISALVSILSILGLIRPPLSDTATEDTQPLDTGFNSKEILIVGLGMKNHMGLLFCSKLLCKTNVNLARVKKYLYTFRVLLNSSWIGGATVVQEVCSWH